MINPKADFVIIQNDTTQVTFTYAPKIGWVTWPVSYFDTWKGHVELMEKNPSSLESIIEKFSSYL